MEMQSKVLEFHKAFGAFIAPGIGEIANEKVRALRIKLLNEEFGEYIDAEEANDLVEIADALADMLYIIFGTAVSYGIPLEEVFDEVHASNMSKLGPDGKPILREDGKVLKGPLYFRPRIEQILYGKNLEREVSEEPS